MHPLGGQIGADSDGLGPKQPELFDIHVMLFAGDPESTVQGLAHFFAIDRDAAQRLFIEVPVVVKRAADPEVAAEMVDVLGELGAQVVLLPAASAVPSETDILELKAPEERERGYAGGGYALGEPSEPPPRSQGADAWGGLDGKSERAPAFVVEEQVDARVQERADSRMRERADARTREQAERVQMQREQAARAPRRAATEDLLAAAPMAELDLDGGSDDASAIVDSLPPSLMASPDARGGHAAAPRANATLRHEPASLPPYAAQTDDGLVIAPLYDPQERARVDHAAHSVQSVAPPPVRLPSGPPDLGLGSVPPLPDLGLGAVPPLPGFERTGSLPPPGKPGLPPVPSAATGKNKRVPPPPPHAGSATLLEAGRASRRPAPPPPPSNATLGGPAAQRAFYERTIEAAPSDALKLPSLTPKAPVVEPRAPAKAAQGDGYWSGRRAAAAGDASDLDDSIGAPLSNNLAGATSATSTTAGTSVGMASAKDLKAAQSNKLAAAAEADARTRSTVRTIGQPLLEILGGIGVFALGIQQDNSILYGNASLVFVLFHAVAIYAIGAGLAEIKS